MYEQEAHASHPEYPEHKVGTVAVVDIRILRGLQTDGESHSLSNEQEDGTEHVLCANEIACSIHKVDTSERAEKQKEQRNCQQRRVEPIKPELTIKFER